MKHVRCWFHCSSVWPLSSAYAWTCAHLWTTLSTDRSILGPCLLCLLHKKQIILYTKQLKFQVTLVVMICAWMTSSPPSDGGLQPWIPMRCQQCSLTTVSPLISFFAGLAGFVSPCVDNMQNCRDVSRTQLSWCVYAHCDACGAMWGNTYVALRQIQAAPSCQHTWRQPVAQSLKV